MLYKIEFKPQSLKDGGKTPKKDLKRIFEKIEALKENMFGDVKHLTNTEPEYRLRVGDYRVLFEVEGKVIVVYRIGYRKDIYR
ncbi:MAG: type II toxin-antitoxin system RelE/ParE family toxin [Nitrospirota bacterium]